MEWDVPGKRAVARLAWDIWREIGHFGNYLIMPATPYRGWRWASPIISADEVAAITDGVELYGLQREMILLEACYILKERRMSVKEQGVIQSHVDIVLAELEALMAKWAPAVKRKATNDIGSYADQFVKIIEGNVKILRDLGQRQDANLNVRYSALVSEGNSLRSQSISLLAQAGVAGFMPGVQVN